MQDRSLLVLLILFGIAAAGGRERGAVGDDEEHPRKPGRALPVVFKPYYCSRCVEEGRLQAERRPVTMMRVDAEKIAKACELGKDWTVIESPNFKLLANLRAAKVKPKDSRFIQADMRRLRSIFPGISFSSQASKLTPHQRAHLYHIRLERLYAHFRALTGNTDPWLGMGAAYEIYLFAKVPEFLSFTGRYFGRRHEQVGVRHHVRDDPNFLAFATSDAHVDGGDAAFSNHVFHNAAHLLMDGYANYYRETWAWLKEGIAHYYTRKETPRHNVFCWSEGKRPTMFEKPYWRRAILALVRRGKDTPLGRWCEKMNAGELTEAEQGMCWSVVEWLVETEPVRLATVIDKLQDYRNKPSAAQTIEFAFGIPPNALHERWREYVLSTYTRQIYGRR